MSEPLEASPSVAPLHVLFVLDDDIVQRFGPTIRQLCVGFVDESVRVTILAPAELDVEDLVVGATRVVSHGGLGWPFRSRSIRRVMERLGGDEPDVIHALSGRAATLGRQVATAFDAPLVVHVTSSAELVALEHPGDEPPTAFVTVSSPLWEAARRMLPDSAERVSLIRPGIHARRSPTCFAQIDRIPTILSLTRFQGQHGLDPFLDAVRDLIQRGTDLMVVLMGTGPLEAELRRQVVALGLLKTVTFTGPIVNRQAALDSADIVVSTRSLSEFRIHQLESMAAGLAIVAAGGGIDDFLIDEQTALLFDPAMPGQLALQLNQLLEQRELARRLAAEAQEHIRRHHQPSAMITAIVELYRHLVFRQKTMKFHSK